MLCLFGWIAHKAQPHYCLCCICTMDKESPALSMQHILWVLNSASAKCCCPPHWEHESLSAAESVLFSCRWWSARLQRGCTEMQFPYCRALLHSSSFLGLIDRQRCGQWFSAWSTHIIHAQRFVQGAYSWTAAPTTSHGQSDYVGILCPPADLG